MECDVCREWFSITQLYRLRDGGRVCPPCLEKLVAIATAVITVKAQPDAAE